MRRRRKHTNCVIVLYKNMSSKPKVTKYKIEKNNTESQKQNNNTKGFAYQRC